MPHSPCFVCVLRIAAAVAGWPAARFVGINFIGSYSDDNRNFVAFDREVNTPAGNYIRSKNLSAPSLSLADIPGSVADSLSRAPINTVQISAMPLPASLVELALGVAAVLAALTGKQVFLSRRTVLEMIPVFGFAFTCVGDAQATVIAVESFAYATGPIDGKREPSNGWSGPWAGGGQVMPTGLHDPLGNLAVVGGSIMTASNSFFGAAFRNLDLNPVSRPDLADLLDGGKLGRDDTSIWIGLLADGTQASMRYTYAGVSPFDGGVEQVFLGKPWDNDVWGIDINEGTMEGHILSGKSVHSSVFLVERIDFYPGEEQIFVWVDPELDHEPADNTADIVSRHFDFRFDRFRIDGSTPVIFDELRIGTTFRDVAPTPEPHSLGLAVAGLLALVALPRKRHRPTRNHRDIIIQ